MATTHWRTGFTVADLHSLPDAGWSFYQLVRTLLPSQLDSIDDDLFSMLDQHFSFKACHQADFPAGEVRNISLASGGADNVHGISSIGNYISGQNGVLPDGILEWVVNDTKDKSGGALVEFLDIFNHRLQSLRYAFKALNDNTLASTSAEFTHIGKFLLALSGNSFESHQRLYDQSPDALINMAGSLANRRMCLPTIQSLFKAVLGLPLHSMQNLVGRWRDVAEEDHTMLGQANSSLGSNAALGTRIWDQQAAVGVRIEPLSVKRLRNLVPGGREHPKLISLLQWITDGRVDCQVTLVAQKSLSDSVKLTQRSDKANRLNMLSRLGQSDDVTPVTFMVDLVGLHRS
jgi:type VI secretion system ImpH/TssG family protein